MVGGKLVVVEVVALRRMLATDMDDGDGWIGEVCGRRFTADNRHAVNGGQQATGEEFVFMRTSGMSEDEGKHFEG